MQRTTMVISLTERKKFGLLDVQTEELMNIQDIVEAFKKVSTRFIAVENEVRKTKRDIENLQKVCAELRAELDANQTKASDAELSDGEQYVES